jgi:EamA domain-containing membrane protein RarD
MRFEHYEAYLRQHPRFGTWYTSARRQPSWAVKAALAAAGIVVVVPVVLLTLAAAITGLVVFGFLALVAGGMRSLGSLFDFSEPQAPTPRDDGRRNVRVVQR